MKKCLALYIVALLLVGLCACGNGDVAETTEPAPDYIASAEDKAQLEKLYEGRIALHGEFHDHADTGGKSDGKTDLRVWKEFLMYIADMDFATIVDHRQVLHMRLPEWDLQYFVGGSEAAANIGGLSDACTQDSMHYNMIFSNPEGLEAVLYQFPDDYKYKNDVFTYPEFMKDKFMEVVQCILDNGGFFTHVHPLGDSYIASTDPEDYWFGDNTGFEVLCGYYGNMSAQNNQEARDFWVKMLDMGKRVFATAGSDSHRLSNFVSVSTFYSKAHNADEIVKTARTGNFTAGPVGIRMSMGETVTGGVCSFEDQRLVISVNDFYSKQYNPKHIYRLDVYTDAGLVASQELTDTSVASYLALDVDPAARYYRAEVYNVTSDYIFAVGNPIWNSALYTGNVIAE